MVLGGGLLRRRRTVGQCTRDSNRAIARHCETVRYFPDRGPGRIRAISGLVTPPPEKVTRSDAPRPPRTEP